MTLANLDVPGQRVLPYGTVAFYTRRESPKVGVQRDHPIHAAAGHRRFIWSEISDPSTGHDGRSRSGQGGENAQGEATERDVLSSR